MDNAKKNHSLTVEKLQEENKKTEEQLNETMMMRMKLEQHIMDLEDNFTDRDSHSFQKVPPLFAGRESELFRNSFDEYNDPFAVNQNQDEPGAGPVSMRYLFCWLIFLMVFIFLIFKFFQHTTFQKTR